jgi:glycosyltransferase involved in cell wall biosynthesis
MHFLPSIGGATLRFLSYLQGFQERGLDVRILTGTPKKKKLRSFNNTDPNKFLQNEPEALKALKNIPVQRIDLPGKAGRRRAVIFSQALLNYCRQPGYRPDVVQVVSSFQPRSLPWIMRLQKMGIKVVYAYTIANKTTRNPWRRVYRKWTLRLLYQRLDCVVVSSEMMMKDLTVSVGPQARVEVIPNGVDLKRFRPADNPVERRALRSALGLDDNHQMITMIGSVHPRKGSDLLMEAWVDLAKRFPDAHMFLVGLRKDLGYPDLSDFRRKIDGLLAASGAAGRVHFTGHIDNVPDYLRASDVFVFPSKREGMPNAVIEAMTCGLPVVLTSFEGLSEEFGKPGLEYLMADRQAESIAASVAEVLNNKKLAAKLGQSARSCIEKTMGLELILDRYADLYCELAGERRQSGGLIPRV